MAKSRKYQRIFEEHSPEKITTSSEKDLSQQVEHMQVPKGRDQVSGGVSVPCRHATPVAQFLLYKNIGKNTHNNCKVLAFIKVQQHKLF